MPDLDSKAVDFRAASESFAGVRNLARRDLENLRLVTGHQGRKVPTGRQSYELDGTLNGHFELGILTMESSAVLCKARVADSRRQSAN